ncbi:protein FAR-RED IMPAIRED RESPONSE 1-like [Cornus florida]|uniref:protein FAR-RED IMPAIRED RESPONSE 1-like n=1 Tax=Cornus florida TaxID=4283 RepID=UPI00289C02AF|nr:protein FAR-RED IMPAIRED RESPONSE 1-like [Cornus florida]
MYDETTDSFGWLFNTFLKAISNKAPTTILTDQDAAMAKAIFQLMPDTKHLLCIWHIMQNTQKHLRNLSVGGKGIKSVISKLMYEIEDEEEFMVEWALMEQEFPVENNNWLANLFHLKHVWAKAYVKHMWSASMRTTQLSESFNARLKQYLARQYVLLEFFKHFEMLLFDNQYKEYAAEYDLLHRMPKLKARGFVYEVAVYNNNLHWLVIRTHDDLLSCSYGKFEMEGIMCNHTLKVFKDVMSGNEIPSRYILKRWTRNAKDGKVEDILGIDVTTDPRLEMRRRHIILCRYLTEIFAIASLSDDGFNNVLLQVISLKKIAQGSEPNPRPACKQTA